MSREAERYETIKNFRVQEVVDNYRYRPEKLYKVPAEQEVTIDYVLGDFAMEQFSSVDEALAVIRKTLDGDKFQDNST